jgi:hypothetical protein
MKKSIQVGLLLMNDGLVKSTYRSKRNLPGIRSITDRQKQISRIEISSVLRRVRGGEFESSAVDDFTEHCFRLGLDANRYEKLKFSDNPHCLLLIPQIGGDPHLVVVDENEWQRNMGDDRYETDADVEPITQAISDCNQIVLDRQDLVINEIAVEVIDVFSKEQMKLLQKVAQIKASLNTMINPTAGANTKYRHVILAGAAGLGKTHFVKSFLQKNNLPHERITGAVSLFSLGVRLAYIMANRNPNETLYIHIDDMDVAFKTEEGCNLLKQMLFDENAFVHERNIGPLLPGFPNEVRDAVESFRSENTLGFRVPLENVVFLITTNVPLPSDSEVANLFGRSGQSGILVHRNAIRSRCRYRYLDFSREMRWAWIASVFLVDFRIPDHENFIMKVMLDFLWENRHTMQEYTIRTAELMQKIAREYPKTFYVEWQNEFLWHLN